MIFGILFSFLLFLVCVCMSKVILSFRFYFCLRFPAGRRTGLIALNRDEAKSTSSASVVENLLNLLWWPFLRLFNCEKECLSVPGIRRLFWVVFFLLLAVHVYGQAAVTYRFPSDHRSQAPSSGVSTWMGDHPGTPRAVGNSWCTRHMAKPRPQVGRVC